MLPVNPARHSGRRTTWRIRLQDQTGSRRQLLSDAHPFVLLQGPPREVRMPRGRVIWYDAEPRSGHLSRHDVRAGQYRFTSGGSNMVVAQRPDLNFAQIECPEDRSLVICGSRLECPGLHSAALGSKVRTPVEEEPAQWFLRRYDRRKPRPGGAPKQFPEEVPHRVCTLHG